MQAFDVVIVGAGPAGAHCARTLAHSGLHVLVVERSRSHAHNAFSSAASPLSVLERFELPIETVESHWHSLKIISSNESVEWEQDKPLGVVFSFARLRAYLCDEAAARGSQVLLGHQYLSHNGKSVKLRDLSCASEFEVQTRILIDATGPARAVMQNEAPLAQDLTTAIGMEYLIASERNSRTLEFLMGTRWAKNGYGWIFPSDPGKLKVGICIYHLGNYKTESLKLRLENIMKHFVTGEYKILETHAGTLKISKNLTDVYANGHVLAIGDAVSAVNPLGGEGIRHGMVSAELAALAVRMKIKRIPFAFWIYKWRMKFYCGFKWRVSSYLTGKVYGELSDAGVDRGVRLLKNITASKMMKILFGYSTRVTLRAAFPVLARRVKKLFSLK